MRIVRFVPVAAVTLLGLCVASASAQSKDPAVDKLVAGWTAAFEKGDAKMLAGFYTEDAIRVTPEGGRVIGRDAILKEFQTNLAGPWKGAAIKITVGSVETVAPDIAVGEGTYEVTGAKGPDGKPMPPIKGHYVNTMVKKNGAWVLASNAAVLPQPAPMK